MGCLIWFTSIKSTKDYEYQALKELLSLEGTALDKLGLTKDPIKEVSKVISKFPKLPKIGSGW